MMKRITTACFIFIALSSSVIAQDMLKIAEDKDSKRDTKECKIQSLEGKGQTIHIMPDYYNNVLKISCLKDTIVVNAAPTEIHIIDRKFAMISYDVRGGSNLGLGNLLLLCVSQNKLFEAMHVLKYVNSETGDEKETYNLKAVLFSTHKKAYQLNVDIADKAWWRYHPEMDYKYYNRSVLNFDVKRKVFYSLKEDIYDGFVVTDAPKGKSHKQKLAGNYPVIILGKEDYYFINGEWCEKDDNNEYAVFR